MLVQLTGLGMLGKDSLLSVACLRPCQIRVRE